MQQRAQKFRQKKKQEIANLRQALVDRVEPNEAVTVSNLGKREHKEVEDIEEEFAMMKQKI